ncbi:MAG: hypothetical protein ACOY3P_14300, partial [Planctomycetota bacterium]
ASEPSGTPEQHLARKRACAQRGIQMGCNAVTHLSLAAQLTGWPTPNAMEGGATSRSGERKGELLIGGLVQGLTGWATPARRDSRYPNATSYQDRSNSTKGEQLNNQVVHGLITQSSTAATARPAALVLNPAMSRWLQAFPAAWDQSSPGWQEWRRLQDAIASGGCEGMETP